VGLVESAARSCLGRFPDADQAAADALPASRGRGRGSWAVSKPRFRWTDDHLDRVCQGKSLLQLLNISAAKWRWIIRNGIDYYNHRLVDECVCAGCALCWRFGAGNCFGCPLDDRDSPVCCKEFYLWDKKPQGAEGVLRRIEREMAKIRVGGGR
jgi:hypothetical protein